jgi:hypothetical protein
MDGDMKKDGHGPSFVLLYLAQGIIRSGEVSAFC